MYNFMSYYWDELHEDVKDSIEVNRRNGLPSWRRSCGCHIDTRVESWVLCAHHQKMQTGD